MPLKKIKDAERPCLHPEHDVPMHIVLEAGEYEYTCPQCGKTVQFTVPSITCDMAISPPIRIVADK